MLFAACQCAIAQDNENINGFFSSKKYNKWNSSVNFKKGMAATDDPDGDYELARQYFVKEAKLHPSNGYALCNEAVTIKLDADIALNHGLYDIFNEYGLDEANAEASYQQLLEEKRKTYKVAIDKLEKGMKLLPAADKGNLCLAHLTLASMFDPEGDEAEKIEQHLKQAIEIHPCGDAFKDYFDYCVEHEQYDTAEAIADRMAQYIDEDLYWMPKVAKVYYDNEHYDKALPWINKVLEIDSIDSKCLLMRYNIRLENQDYEGALEDIMTVAKGDDYDAGDIANELSKLYGHNEAKALVISRLRELELGNDEDVRDDEARDISWNYLEGSIRLYEDNDYANALPCLQRSLKDSYSAQTFSEMAQCAFMLGDVPQAMSYLKSAIYNGETDYNSVVGLKTKQNIMKQKIMYELCNGMVDDMIHDIEVYNIAFENDAEDTDLIDYLSWGYQLKGEYAKALEVLDNNGSNNEDLLLQRAQLLLQLGRDGEAQDLLQNIVQDATQDQSKMFALFYQGKREESRAMLDALALKSNDIDGDVITHDDGNAIYPQTMSNYRLAEAYALHGDSEKALYYLEQWFKDTDSPMNFEYTKLNSNFDNIKKMPEFTQLINRYKRQWLSGEYGLKQSE